MSSVPLSKTKEYYNQRYRKHREIFLARNKARYKRDKEKILVRQKEYYKFKHELLKLDPEARDEALRKHRQYYWNHRQEALAKTKERNNTPERKRQLSDYAKKWNTEHRDEQTAKRRYRRQNCRLKVIAHYTNGTMKCKCGYNDIRALTIDHINGGGSRHVKLIGRHLDEWIVRNNYPVGFQILCMNCQFIKALEEKEWTPAKSTNNAPSQKSAS